MPPSLPAGVGTGPPRRPGALPRKRGHRPNTSRAPSPVSSRPWGVARPAHGFGGLFGLAVRRILLEVRQQIVDVFFVAQAREHHLGIGNFGPWIFDVLAERRLIP